MLCITVAGVQAGAADVGPEVSKPNDGTEWGSVGSSDDWGFDNENRAVRSSKSNISDVGETVGRTIEEGNSTLSDLNWSSSSDKKREMAAGSCQCTDKSDGDKEATERSVQPDNEPDGRNQTRILDYVPGSVSDTTGLELNDKTAGDADLNRVQDARNPSQLGVHHRSMCSNLVADNLTEWTLENADAGLATPLHPGDETLLTGGLLRPDGLLALLSLLQLDGQRGDAVGVRTPNAPVPADSRDDKSAVGGARDDSNTASNEPWVGDRTSQKLDRDGSDEAEGGPNPESGAGALAVLFLTVGCLGATRTGVGQTLIMASPKTVLQGLKQTVVSRLEAPFGWLFPAVFGYNRWDDSEPLENDTREQIFQRVMESPGTYYAQVAAETDVTVETVRYHARTPRRGGARRTPQVQGASAALPTHDGRRRFGTRRGYR